MDPNQPAEFREHAAWRELDETLSIFQIDPDTESVSGFSFSGNERNRMFLNRDGSFEDISLTSGVDYPEDGRGFAVFDFDNDGNLDLGITSNQKPRFRIATRSSAVDGTAGNFAKIRLVGGNDSAEPSKKLSPRDPVGAIVVATMGNSQRMFQVARGEGFSVQNSSTLHIGMGKVTQIDRLEIRWPSGLVTVRENVAAGATVEIFESGN